MLIFFQQLCLLLFLWLLKLVDGLMEIFSAISGITDVTYKGEKVNIIEFLAGDSTVNTIFWCIFILAIGLTCIFTIAALIKNMINSQRNVSTIVGKFFLALLGTMAMLTVLFLIIRIESVASIFSLAFNFIMVGMVTLGKEKYVYALTTVKLVLCLLVDTFMVSTLPVSLNLGVNGIAFSNIIVNVLLVATAIILLRKEGIVLFQKAKLSFGWMKDFAKVGGISGLESFVRNIAYMLMIVRMVNMVGEQGTYWVANNFIWGWLFGNKYGPRCVVRTAELGNRAGILGAAALIER